VSNASVEGIETTRTFLSLIAAALSTAKPTSEPVAIKMQIFKLGEVVMQLSQQFLGRWLCFDAMHRLHWCSQDKI
jgi:hypothetical protein